MSKAFTRENDAGLEPVRGNAPAAPPQTRMGRAHLVERLAEALLAGDATRVIDLEASLATGIVVAQDDPSVPRSSPLTRSS